MLMRGFLSIFTESGDASASEVNLNLETVSSFSSSMPRRVTPEILVEFLSESFINNNYSETFRKVVP